MKRKNNDIKIDFGDPLEDWIRRAYKFADDLCLPADFINEAKCIVVNAFTERWLNKEFQDKTFPLIFKPHRHEIAQHFLTAGESQIVDIIELAIYLKTLAKDQNINKVVIALCNMKQYRSAFLQLSFAYRFLKFGATNMKLEPPADNGRFADIFFRIGNESFLCECFCPDYSKDKDSIEELVNFGLANILDMADNKKIKVLIVLNAKTSLSAKQRKQIEVSCYHLIGKLCEGKILLEDDLPCCQIKIYNATEIKKKSLEDYNLLINQLTTDSDCGINQSWVEKDQLEKVRDGISVRIMEGSRVFVKRPPEETDPNWLSELTKKIESKICQVRRRADNPKGIIIVNSGLGLLRDPSDVQSARSIQRKILGVHKNLAAVLLTTRVWTIKQRYQYRTAFLLSLDKSIFSKDDYFYKMNDFEDKMDLLTDWQKPLGDIKPARTPKIFTK